MATPGISYSKYSLRMMKLYAEECMGSISTNEWGAQPDTLGVDTYPPLFTQTKSGGRQGEKERRKRGRLLSS